MNQFRKGYIKCASPTFNRMCSIYNDALFKNKKETKGIRS